MDSSGVMTTFLNTDASVCTLLAIAFILAFLLAFSVGANDVANSFGTVVGAKIITIKQAFVIASIFELLGSVLIGAKVSDTIRTKIVDPNVVQAYYARSTNCFYTNYTSEDISTLVPSHPGNQTTSKKVTLSCPSMVEMIGAASALGGAASWLTIANVFSLPVSGTHSIVGAVIGYGVAALAGKGIGWTRLISIVASWIISPLFSGFVSSVVYYVLCRFVLVMLDSYMRMIVLVPYILFGVMFINVFSIFYHDSGSDKNKDTPFTITKYIPLYGSILLAFGLGLFTAFICRFWYLKRVKRNIEFSISGLSQGDSKKELLESSSATAIHEDVHETKTSEIPGTTIVSADTEQGKVNTADSTQAASTTLRKLPCSGGLTFKTYVDREDPRTWKLFYSIQVVMSAFGSFSHGGNDVSNAVAPLITSYLVYITGSSALTASTGFPYFIMIFGGVSIVIGLIALGKRVMKTIGTDLSEITPPTAFCIELGSGLTVLLATVIGFPVSTTHCKVGSVVLVGMIRHGKKKVNWKLFRNIAISWLITVPVSALASGLLYLIISSAIFLS